MVARSAFTQLRYSPWLLAGTLAGRAWLYALPVASTLAGLTAITMGGAGAGPLLCLAAGLTGWAAMTAQLPADAQAVPAVTAAAPPLPCHRHPLRGDDRRFGPPALPWPGRRLERPNRPPPGAGRQAASGKRRIVSPQGTHAPPEGAGPGGPGLSVFSGGYALKNAPRKHWCPGFVLSDK